MLIKKKKDFKNGHLKNWKIHCRHNRRGRWRRERSVQRWFRFRSELRRREDSRGQAGKNGGREDENQEGEGGGHEERG